MDETISLEQTRLLVNEQMKKLFEMRLQTATEIGGPYQTFWSHIKTVAFAGGKRLRPYLTMIGNGAIDERVVPVAVAQELIHIAMLIHDDVIDQDFMRHGVKNINGIYKGFYANYLNDSRATHYANSSAILAGDALISEAYRIINEAKFSEEIKYKLSEQLSISIFEVIGGELLDVEAGFVDDQIIDPLAIYRYKTSSYSFIGPLISGAYCSETSQSDIDRLKQFALNAGIAFQIQDDLLGVFGNEKETGKSTITDIKERKHTLLALNHKKLMNEGQKKHFVYYGDMNASDEQLNIIKKDMLTSGARQKTEEQTEHYYSAAIEQLNQLPRDVRTTELRNLIEYLKGRNK